MLLYFMKKRNHPNAQNFIIVFFTKDFKRLIDVVHEGRKLSYNESLATNILQICKCNKGISYERLTTL